MAFSVAVNCVVPPLTNDFDIVVAIVAVGF